MKRERSRKKYQSRWLVTWLRQKEKSTAKKASAIDIMNFLPCKSTNIQCHNGKRKQGLCHQSDVCIVQVHLYKRLLLLIFFSPPCVSRLHTPRDTFSPLVVTLISVQTS